ncbi:uncharacterized protein LACBIDRAFT_317726 [Laccaria bicolor S238N-H82]|uniref:Predicted protein n=1 Tax=Laccaria bicolor (strain S238N-H82 / ATCC MYA-4686) TaxID=486041 RepID=B0E291_LACBS|nr:uncharacterized protein LACBIDRAFT_317726 [Laccaria bicolor S238N-H82]EDQ99032.1 predicted protein [Laccaria bicolor S238N-H82]|eukprot:XP_001890307.1 predicted protein [Laccaria bicolor S238N-H82]
MSLSQKSTANMADVAQGVANVVQDEVDVDVVENEAALLTPLKKGCVKRSRQKFLKSHLEEYKTVLLVSHEKATSFLDGIVNLWFSMYHWSIPVTQEELPTSLPFPTGTDGFEILTKKQATLKGKVIERMRKSLYNWFDHRSKKMKTLKWSKSTKDPLSILVNHLLGYAGPAKLRTGWEMWGTANYESLREPFKEPFRESGKPEKHCATFRNSFKKKEFHKLSEEEQKQWADDAIEAHNTAKKAWEGDKEMSPAEAQRSIRWSHKSFGTVAGKDWTSTQHACFGVCGWPRAKVGGEHQCDKCSSQRQQGTLTAGLALRR